MTTNVYLKIEYVLYNLRWFFFTFSSVVYLWDSNNRFTIHQQISTKGAVDVTSFMLDNSVYIAMGNQRDNMVGYEQSVIVYMWNIATNRFEPVQEISAIDVQKVHSYPLETGFGTLILLCKFPHVASIYE